MMDPTDAEGAVESPTSGEGTDGEDVIVQLIIGDEIEDTIFPRNEWIKIQRAADIENVSVEEFINKTLIDFIATKTVLQNKNEYEHNQPERTHEMTVELGKQYRDKVSGWTGIATAEYKYMNGCLRYELGGSDKDGKPETFVFDEQQLELVSNGLIEQITPKSTGGPRDSQPVTWS